MCQRYPEGKPMRLFYFTLKCGWDSIADVEGQEFPDNAAARRHAVAVARDLMRHREPETRPWRIEVCDDYLQPLFEVPFAHVDETLAEGYPRDFRISIKRVARMSAAFNSAMIETRATLGDVQKTLARVSRLLASFPASGRI